MLKDALGNTLKTGDLCFSKTLGCTVRIGKVEGGGVETPQNGRTPTKFVLELVAEVKPRPDGVTVAGDLVRVVDPNSERVIEGMVSGVTA